MGTETLCTIEGFAKLNQIAIYKPMYLYFIGDTVMCAQCTLQAVHFKHVGSEVTRCMDISSLEFIPHSSFKSLFEDQEVREIWTLLKKPESIIIAKTAVYLNRSPVEALTPQLLSLSIFSEEQDKKKVDRVKQLTGSMVRCIMEASGYEIAEGRHRIKASTPKQKQLFKTSAVYAKKDEIKG